MKISFQIPLYTRQFLYHIHLNSEKHFSINTKQEWECAAFLLSDNAVINEDEFKKGEFLLFDRNEGSIEISNEGNGPIDIILFGGEPFTEPIVAQRPFVMNTQQEIAKAYTDFHAGKYGKINYQ